MDPRWLFVNHMLIIDEEMLWKDENYLLEGLGLGRESLKVAAGSCFWSREECCSDSLSSRQSFKSKKQILGLFETLPNKKTLCVYGYSFESV